jgi:hypothetical protein
MIIYVILIFIPLSIPMQNNALTVFFHIIRLHSIKFWISGNYHYRGIFYPKEMTMKVSIPMAKILPPGRWPLNYFSLGGLNDFGQLKAIQNFAPGAVIKVRFLAEFLADPVQWENNTNALFREITFNHPDRREQISIACDENYLFDFLPGCDTISLQGDINVRRFFLMGVERGVTIWAKEIFLFKHTQYDIDAINFSGLNEHLVSGCRISPPIRQGSEIIDAAKRITGA